MQGKGDRALRFVKESGRKPSYEDPLETIEKAFTKNLADDWRKYYMLHPYTKLVPMFEKEEQADGSVTYRIIYKPVVAYDVQQNRR